MYFDVGTRSKKYYIGYFDEAFEVLLISNYVLIINRILRN